MKPLVCIGVQVNARVVGGELLHFIEAVLGQICRLVARLTPPFLKYSAIVGVSFRRKFSSPGATTIDSALRMGILPVMNEARPAVQLACPYQDW